MSIEEERISDSESRVVKETAAFTSRPRSDWKFSPGDNPRREIEVQCGNIIFPSLLPSVSGLKCSWSNLEHQDAAGRGGWRGIKGGEEEEEEEAAEGG